MTGYARTLPRTRLLRQLRTYRAGTEFRGEQARREHLMTELRKARLTGIRVAVAVPVEALEGRLSGLPAGVVVEHDSERRLRASGPEPRGGAGGGRPVPVTASGFRECDDCPEMVVVPAGTFLAATAHVARGCSVYALEVRSFARDRAAPRRVGGRMRVKEMHTIHAVRSLVVAFLAFIVVAVPAVVLADGRVALVVGNSTYAHIGRLPSPDSDAVDMSAALRRLGFDVDRVELTEALRAFTRQSAGADVSLVFYAAHGIEMDGVNYLVPLDARLERDVDVRFETVTVDDLLVSTSGELLQLAILDACRTKPAGAFDAAHGSNPHGERGLLRTPHLPRVGGTPPTTDPDGNNVAAFLGDDAAGMGRCVAALGTVVSAHGL